MQNLFCLFLIAVACVSAQSTPTETEAHRDSVRAELQAEKRQARSLREAELYQLNLCLGGTLELGLYGFKSKFSSHEDATLVDGPVGLTLGLRKHFSRLLGWQGHGQFLFSPNTQAGFLNAEARLIFGPFGRFAIEPGAGYSYGWYSRHSHETSGYDTSTQYLQAFVFCPGATFFLGARDALTLSAGPKIGWGLRTGLLGVFARISYAIPLNSPRASEGSSETPK